MNDELKNEYFEWLYNIACGTRYAPQISYRKLLMKLHLTKFRYSIRRDQNRAEDGESMRYRYALVCNYFESLYEILDILQGPCSVLEMMLSLAIRCEENIMDDPAKGDRTGQWFWEMIVSLGLSGMNDDRYDRDLVDDAIDTFLDRKYEPNGKGGLFTIYDCDHDLRRVEIWHQMLWHLNRVT